MLREMLFKYMEDSYPYLTALLYDYADEHHISREKLLQEILKELTGRMQTKDQRPLVYRNGRDL